MADTPTTPAAGTPSAATPSDATPKDSSGNQPQPGAAVAAAPAEGKPVEAASSTAATDTKADAKGTEGEGKPQDAAALELKLPEGFQADDALMGEFRSVAKDLGLDSAKAQKFVDLYAKASGALTQQAEAAHAKQVEDWGKAIQADKDLGGDNLPATRKLADAALGRFATPEFKALLDASGLGNHPDLVRVFRDIGKALADDTVTRGNPGSGSAVTPANDAQSLHEFLYPTMFKKAK
jgi:hypothetical protein